MEGNRVNILQLLKTVELEFPRENNAARESESGGRFEELFGKALNQVREAAPVPEAKSAQGMDEPVRGNLRFGESEPSREEAPETATTSTREENDHAAGPEEEKATEAEPADAADATEKGERAEAVGSDAAKNSPTDSEGATLVQRIEQLVEEMMSALKAGRNLPPAETGKLAEKIESRINQLLEGRLNVRIEVKADARITVAVDEAKHGAEKQAEIRQETGKPVQELLRQVEELAGRIARRSQGGEEQRQTPQLQATVTRLEVRQERTLSRQTDQTEMRGDSAGPLRETARDRAPRLRRDDGVTAQAVLRNERQGAADEAESRVLLAALARKRLAARPVTVQGLEPSGRQVSGEENARTVDVGARGRLLTGVSLGKEGMTLQKSMAPSLSLSRMAPAEQVAETIARTAKTTRLTLELHPRDLGRVELDLRVSGDRLVAQFRTESAQARDALQNNAHLLRDALAEKGFDTQKMEIRFASGGADAEGSFGHAGKERQEEEARRQKEEKNFSPPEEPDSAPVAIDAALRAAQSTLWSPQRLNLRA